MAEARQAGDRDLARAIARLRRPTRAAWLANLLARERAEQLDGLLALANDLASAQRTLDGGALRALSAQRSRLVSAMAREGGRLAAQAGDIATESVVRDLAGILDAALADPAVAAEVRSGRLTRTVSYSGFGPGPGSAPAERRPPDARRRTQSTRDTSAASRPPEAAPGRRTKMDEQAAEEGARGGRAPTRGAGRTGAGPRRGGARRRRRQGQARDG